MVGCDLLEGEGGASTRYRDANLSINMQSSFLSGPAAMRHRFLASSRSSSSMHAIRSMQALPAFRRYRNRLITIIRGLTDPKLALKFCILRPGHPYPPVQA